jgi:glycosyltransferase involved in cell wall biosynthesis
VKIALFVHCFYPAHFYGTETYTLDLARNLKLLGHDPVVVTAVFPGEPQQPSFVHRYDYDGIPVVSLDKNRLPNGRVKDTYYQPDMAEPLRNVVEEIAPEIAHVTHLVNHTAVLLEVLAAQSIPVVATFTDFFGFCYTNRLEAHDGSACEGPSRDRTNCLACHIKAVAAGKTGWKARSLRIPPVTSIAASAIFNVQRLPGLRRASLAGLVQDVVQRPDILGELYSRYRMAIVPTKLIESAYRRNGFRQPMVRIAFGVDIARQPKPDGGTRPLTLGFIGQLMAHKGPDLLIDACRDALGAAGYELRLYGSETQDPAYAAALREAASGAPVHFMGTFAPSRMREVLDQLDVLVIPSRWYENSPLVLLNALASHTPVIVSDVEGMTEFVEDDRNGLVFSRDDRASLASVLARIRKDAGLLRRLASNAHYAPTTRTMTSATLAVYETVLHGSSPVATARAVAGA